VGTSWVGFEVQVPVNREWRDVGTVGDAAGGPTSWFGFEVQVAVNREGRDVGTVGDAAGGPTMWGNVEGLRGSGGEWEGMQRLRWQGRYM